MEGNKDCVLRRPLQTVITHAHTHTHKRMNQRSQVHTFSWGTLVGWAFEWSLCCFHLSLLFFLTAIFDRLKCMDFWVTSTERVKQDITGNKWTRHPRIASLLRWCEACKKTAQWTNQPFIAFCIAFAYLHRVLPLTHTRMHTHNLVAWLIPPGHILLWRDSDGMAFMRTMRPASSVNSLI